MEQGKLGQQLIGSLKWQLARLLIGLVVPAFPSLGVTVTDHLLAKAVDTNTCSVPTSTTTFITTDQTVFLWFNVSGANTGDVSSAAWYSPTGAIYKSSSWNPVASAGSWCFWSSISIVGNPPASTPGNWSVSVSWNGSAAFTLNFTIAPPSQGPSINSGGILNAASYSVGTSVAPGSIVAVYGSFPLNSPIMTPVVPWPTNLGGLSMQFGGETKAPLYYVSSGQVNLLVPWELANQSQTSLTATANGQSSPAQTLSLSKFSPGIFSMNGQGRGQGAILDTSYRLVDASNPAIAGSTYVQIYCTGLGPVSNQPASGSVSPSNPLAKTSTVPTVTIGGSAAEVLFSGLAPGFVGEYQVNAQVPFTSSTGNAVPVTISLGGVTSNTVTIAVQPTKVTTTPGLNSVNPNAGNAGQVLTVALNGTNFVQGQTLANFGAGISVGGAPEGQPGMLTVANPSTATATLTIDPAASTGSRIITVATGAQAASLSNAFTVLAPPAPMVPLKVTSTQPINGATHAALTPTIKIMFNDPVDPATIGPSTLSITNGTASVPATLVYDSAKYQVSMAPNGTLRPGATYTVTVGAMLRNVAGNRMGTAYGFSFTTVPPITVTGTITTALGLDPKTLTVLSYGGRTSTPDSNGSFSAAISPEGNTLVAAVFPGKAFALLGVLNSGIPANAATADFPTPSPAVASPLLASRVFNTRWQVTASTAAVSPNPVLDYQTTAETLVFMSPYLYTGDPRKSTATQRAVAQSLSTKQLAVTLQSTMNLADAPAHPMTVAVVQSAMQSAVHETLSSLLPQLATPTTANSTPPTILDLQYCPASPATVKMTPYCKAGSPTSGSELPCLDLDYISFCDAVRANQDRQSYTFTPRNCTNRAWGCAVGWLARFAPISDGTDPNSIFERGSNALVPESPAGHTTTCSPGACYGAWISGNSAAAKLDVFGAFSDWVTSLIIKDSGGSLVLPKSGSYIARFYSGGLANSRETANIDADAYTDGSSLSALATGVNMAETALNIADMAFNLAPGPTTAGEDIAQCALINVTVVAVEAAAGQAAGTVSGGVKAIASLGSSILNNAASCVVSQAAQSLFKLGAEALLASTGVGAVVDAAVNGAAAAADASEALQRSYELTNKASALETAVIEILPGSDLPNNPVPKILSLSPAIAAVGGTAPTVTIKGNFFSQDCTIFANDAKRVYNFVDSGTITFALTSTDLGQPGTFSVEVRNPTPGGGTSASIFTVASGSSSNPQPQVTSLTPSAAPVGTATRVLSILGNNFMSNSAVTFGGSSRAITTPFDARQLTITLTASDLAKTGTFPVVVTNPGPGGGSSGLRFTVLDLEPKQPAVTAISTPQRTYVSGDQFELNYAVLADSAAPTKYDLMITVLSLASGTTYYYYENGADTNRWLHTTAHAAVSNYAPQSGDRFIIPSDPSAFQITSDVPTGNYHVKAYFSVVQANQPVGTYAETDFSIATDTAPGGCFVATAAFGSPMVYQVRWLRAFRDRILLPSRTGRAFVTWYYAWSPRAAAWLYAHAIVRKLTRAALWVPVAFAWSSLRTNVECASLGLLALLLALCWSLRRGPTWWKGVCLLLLAIAVASAQV